MENEIKIDRGVPFPKKRDKPSKLPWQELEVGDSFLFPLIEGGAPATQPRASATAGRYQKDGKKFSTRRVEENGTIVIRVWRTA